MSELDVVKVEVPAGLERLTGAAVFDQIERAVPRAYEPLLVELAADAPRRTGRMAAAGFQAVATRRSAGLVQGVDVRIGSPMPYAHLPAFGHVVIPRGPGRARRMKKERRRQLRAMLNERRAAGPTGFVPPDPWLTDAVERHGPRIAAEIEAALGASPLAGPAR